MRGHNSASKQLTIYGSLTGNFRKESEEAVKKSMPAVMDILLGKEDGGKNLIELIVTSNYQRSYDNIVEVYKGRKQDITKIPDSDTFLAMALRKISIKSLPRLLMEYDVIFQDFIMNDMDMEDVVDSLVFEENRSAMLEMKELERGLAGKYKTLKRGGTKVLGLGDRIANSDYLPISLFAVGMKDESTRPHVESKINSIGEVLYGNGFPDYRSLLFDGSFLGESGKHVERLRKMFPASPGDGADRVNNPAASTFRITDYAGTDPLEEAMRRDEYVSEARFWEGVLKETDYEIHETTKKIVGRLERSVLTTPSLKSDILNYANRTDVFNYLRDIFDREKTRGIVRDYTGSSDDREVSKIIFDLIRFYDAAGPHRAHVEKLVQKYAQKVVVSESFLSKINQASGK